MTRSYEYRHVVTFRETNVFGNVYFVNHLAWQGECREHFLRDHARAVLDQLHEGLLLVTVSCRCDYLEELTAFDEIVLRMSLVETLQNRIDLRFDYFRVEGERELLVAVGQQRIACMARESNRIVPVRIPEPLERALAQFSTSTEQRGKHGE